MQHPILTGHDGGSEEGEPEVWAAQAQLDISILIQRYLAENPPPGPSQTHRDFRLWAANLQRDAQDRLAVRGLRPLRAVRAA